MEPKKQDNKPGEAQPEPKNNGYGKRPWWQWLLIYIAVGGLVYWLIYYFVSASGGNTNSGGLY
jgi:magnesium-transporting ATPase (P-type)